MPLLKSWKVQVGRKLRNYFLPLPFRGRHLQKKKMGRYKEWIKSSEGKLWKATTTSGIHHRYNKDPRALLCRLDKLGKAADFLVTLLGLSGEGPEVSVKLTSIYRLREQEGTILLLPSASPFSHLLLLSAHLALLLCAQCSSWHSKSCLFVSFRLLSFALFLTSISCIITWSN